MTLLLQSSLVLGVSLLFARFAPTPALRRDLLTVGLAATLLLPLMGWLPSPLPALPTVAEVSSLPGPVSALAPLQEPAGVSETSPVPWMALLWSLWMAGVGIQLTRLAHRMMAVRRLPTEPVEPAWQAANGELGLTLRGGSVGPLVAGWLRPVVVVPNGLDWSRARRIRALRHEQAHLRSHDNLRLLLAQVVTALSWCNPLAWLVASELRTAVEQAADAAVVAGGAQPTDVAGDLIDLARTLPLAAGLGSRPLDRRVKALLAAPSAPLSPVVSAALVAALLAATLLVGARNPEAVASEHDVQAIVDGELRALVEKWSPEGAAIVVVDARSGELVASSRHGTVQAWAPGSVVKPFVAVAAIERGLSVDSDEVAHLLEVSDNAGFVALAERVGPKPVASTLQGYGLAGDPTSSPTDLALGQHLATTVELAHAYARLDDTPAGREVLGWLTDVVHGDEGTGKKARVDGLQVAGKTGTSRLGPSDDDGVVASFVGLVPASEPRWAIAVQVAGPEPTGWGGQVAAPGFAAVAKQLP